jgi:hypothetical protein
MASDEKTIIRSLLKPKIVLDELSLADVFSSTSDKIPQNKPKEVTGHQEQNSVGTDYPMVAINNYTISLEELDTFRIDCTGFLPKLFLAFDLVNSTAFKSQAMPKDGDIVNVFIRAKNDVFKPVRNDYVITSVDIGKGGEEGAGASVVIQGELFIPHIRDEVVKSYTGNSFDVIQLIAKELNLGFATNETSTVDSMNWVCPGDSMYNFINHIADHAWKSPKDFYKVYIDVYYHLNFINVNNQFEGDSQLPAAILDSTLVKEYYPNDLKDAKSGQVTLPKMLSNLTDLQNTNFFVKQHQIVNNSSEVAKKWGYKTHVQFFDQKSLKYWDLYIDPLTTTDAEKDKIILKGRTFPKGSTAAGAPSQLDYWKTQNKKMWLGVQSKNVHDKYLFSEVHNKRNREELTKLFIKVDLPRWNPNVANGEKLPLLMQNITDDTKRRLDATGDVADAEPNKNYPTVDQFYTGFYMTDGMIFSFDRIGPGGSYSNGGSNRPDFYQTLFLRRREWPAP